MANRLAGERSPYLLQHAANPVDWYPWGPEALARARAEQKPIFLSIGYSTCHWCHVMERESFEHAGIAAALNAHFVSIKVDREERPDIDRVYMLFVQATTGQGGWPMTVFLTPDLEPFYGGTYFPPTARHGRPGLLDVLEEISRTWREERERVTTSAATLADRLRQATRPEAPADGGVHVAPPQALDEGLAEYVKAYDARWGGFGTAPKFPRPSELLFLLRHHALSGNTEGLDMALETLRAMSTGGLRDHVGGGIHRYSVDAFWRVPHFEKMLYDQAQMVLALLEAGQVSGDPFHASVAEDTLAYVARELTGAEGGFLSAEDADSVPADEAGRPHARPSEGAFYLWSLEELAEAVGDALAPLAAARFGVTAEGNAADPLGELRGRNVLYVARDIEDLARDFGRPVDEIIRDLRTVRVRLHEARRQRPRPSLDDKVLTAWNGLAIAAFARAARQLRGRSAQAETWLRAAERAAQFVRDTLWDANRGVLLRRWRAGEAAIDGYAEDYACLAWGLLELFEATGDAAWLEWTRDLHAQLDDRFWDEVGGGWFSTTGDDPTVLLRMKEDYDGAEPAASAVAVMNLLRLVHLMPDAAALARIERTLARGGMAIGRAARAVPYLLAGLTTYHAGMRQVVIVGDPADPATLALHDVVAQRYLPFAVVVPVTPGHAQARLAHLLPFLETLTLRDQRPTAYVCEGFACQAPTTDPDTLARQLGGAV
ncbi:thioredoxin domain-containing protein [Luteitalea sp. TBR-22]|uniref:thioredoxin domain-containing protein n=1 Tax=Luteitalea sp. TBR-22 TaxID=2802971 RepID=UPI001AF8CF2D|nr:thioredoxin domain-containing protein [Luteitalea sp. TBR-22]BCS33986.1 thioredoxin domain-containing protein [Luteitalea sp. TBR-22]